MPDDPMFFDFERVKDLVEAHAGEEVIVTFMKRTVPGEVREMRCVLPPDRRWTPESARDDPTLLGVLDLDKEAPRMIDLDAVLEIETDWLVYTPID